MIRLVVTLCLVAACLGAPGANLRDCRPCFNAGRVAGGTNANIRDYPYQLSMQFCGMPSGGASIISENWVITAAHCTDETSPDEIQFRAGSSNSESGGSLHQADKIIVNEDYEYPNLDYDVAVIHVAEPFDLSSGVLKAVALTNSTPAAGTLVVVTGWGFINETDFPSQLQAVEVPVVDHQQCSVAYSDHGGVTARMLCTGVPEGGKGPCLADSGGPLVTGGKLVGIVSWGLSCAGPGHPGVYTDVASVRDWIRQKTGI